MLNNLIISPTTWLRELWALLLYVLQSSAAWSCFQVLWSPCKLTSQLVKNEWALQDNSHMLCQGQMIPEAHGGSCINPWIGRRYPFLLPAPSTSWICKKKKKKEGGYQCCQISRTDLKPLGIHINPQVITAHKFQHVNKASRHFQHYIGKKDLQE